MSVADAGAWLRSGTPLAVAAEGARDITPMVVGVVPFALAIGASIGASTLTTAQGVASAPTILAGAAQLTTVEMLEGITPPTSGEVLYKGSPLDARFREEFLCDGGVYDNIGIRKLIWMLEKREGLYTFDRVIISDAGAPFAVQYDTRYDSGYKGFLRLFMRAPDILMRRVADQLRETRLLSLVGPGGAGKTRLSIEVARRHVADGAQGVPCHEYPQQRRVCRRGRARRFTPGRRAFSVGTGTRAALPHQGRQGTGAVCTAHL